MNSIRLNDVRITVAKIPNFYDMYIAAPHRTHRIHILLCGNHKNHKQYINKSIYPICVIRESLTKSPELHFNVLFNLIQIYNPNPTNQMLKHQLPFISNQPMNQTTNQPTKHDPDLCGCCPFSAHSDPLSIRALPICKRWSRWPSGRKRLLCTRTICNMVKIITAKIKIITSTVQVWHSSCSNATIWPMSFTAPVMLAHPPSTSRRMANMLYRYSKFSPKSWHSHSPQLNSTHTQTKENDYYNNNKIHTPTHTHRETHKHLQSDTFTHTN